MVCYKEAALGRGPRPDGHDHTFPSAPVGHGSKSAEPVVSNLARPSGQRLRRGESLLCDRSVFLCQMCGSSIKHFSRAKHLEEKHKISLSLYVKKFGRTEVLR